jgi:hypothetical protein
MLDMAMPNPLNGPSLPLRRFAKVNRLHVPDIADNELTVSIDFTYLSNPLNKPGFIAQLAAG